uniref:Uncharacterized protein n=1 Tax=Maylandia zebra TaxID=106582 RepID=A0A3P9BKH9_9CICH
MEWSVCSADLNSTEHLWDQLGHAVCARVTNTTTLDAIPQQCVTKLVTSMSRRCQAVLSSFRSFSTLSSFNFCC